MAARHVVNEQLVQFGNVTELIGEMLTKARSAFNRHDLRQLRELPELASAITASLGAARQRVDDLMASQGSETHKELLRFHSIFAHQQILAEAASDLVSPIENKIRNGLMFSDKAVAEANALFDRQAGIMRTLRDIVETGSSSLKNQVRQEADQLTEQCLEFATEHEARMIEGVCQPRNSPVFLSLLDTVRTMARHERRIAMLLSDDS